MDDRFLTVQNIQRYRQLLESSRDEEQRKMLLRLLAEEEAKQARLQDSKER